MTITTRRLPPEELEDALPALARLLSDTVNGGSPMGFLPPLAERDACDYWLSLRAELRAGSRLLLVARSGGEIVGSGQLSLSPWPNARHRAEIQKLFVAASMRGRGVGATLLDALHDAAREHGRSLLVLNTRRRGGAGTFYEGLGYRVTGVIPGWTRGPAGERHDHLILIRELA